MLTDIFARRYEDRPLFTAVGPREHALFVQAYRIINEQLFPYYGYGQKVDEKAKATWTSLHDRLTMEFGTKELSAKFYSYQSMWMGKPHTYSGSYEMNSVCENWIAKPFSEGLDPDVFVKRRLSFVELAFRERTEIGVREQFRLWPLDSEVSCASSVVEWFPDHGSFVLTEPLFSPHHVIYRIDGDRPHAQTRLAWRLAEAGAGKGVSHQGSAVPSGNVSWRFGYEPKRREMELSFNVAEMRLYRRKPYDLVRDIERGRLEEENLKPPG